MASAAATSKAGRIKAIGAILFSGIAYGLFRMDTRALVTRFFTGPGNVSRIVALAFVVANFKNFPFVWHYRVWKAIIQRFELSPRRFTPKTGPSALFQPVITSSLSPLTECDYNLHKSNSTYFSDLDTARSHWFGALFSEATRRAQTEKNIIFVDGKPHNGNWLIALGAVHCSFKKEIKPYEQYEMWTSLLAWDRKWLYIITHFVKKGAVRPDGFIKDDGTIAGNRNPKTNGHAQVKTPATSAIFATALSKYVIKLGRLTVHPEFSLEKSNLLPPRPGGWATMSADATAKNLAEDVSASSTFEKVDGESVEDENEWTWQRVVAENEKGLGFARHFAAMDGLHERFDGEGPVVGAYTDLFFK